MFSSGRSLTLAVLPLLVAVAILGYLAGHRHSRAVSEEPASTVSTASVLLTYPSDWQPAAAAPAIPGLSFGDPVVLAPNGDTARAGLIAGQLPGGEASPLPRQFVARMRWLPDTEVVNLLDVQAYRYAQLRIPGFDRMLTLFAIPNRSGKTTALACYASAASSTYLRVCEQIVDTLTLVGQSQSYELTPDAGYARRLSAPIVMLAGQRASLRREMRQGAPRHTLQMLATRMAAGFATAAASLSALKSSLVAGQAQAALADSLLQARDAYTALAAAVDGQNPPRYAATRRQVYEAETSVNAALESFALLGYKT